MDVVPNRVYETKDKKLFRSISDQHLALINTLVKLIKAGSYIFIYNFHFQTNKNAFINLKVNIQILIRISVLVGVVVSGLYLSCLRKALNMTKSVLNKNEENSSFLVICFVVQMGPR